jgi:hypothetical protein
MQGLVRAVARLLVMGFVMTAVLVAAVFAGVGATTAIALGIVLAGIVGLIGVGRRPREGAQRAQLAAMQATLAAGAAAQHTEESTAIEAMAPPLSPTSVDPEANMPRWRRPSLLEARRADPTRQAPVYRLPMRFLDGRTNHPDLRIVRYATVPVLDRPDEVLGIKLADLEQGDEVLAVGAAGVFVEVTCATGDHGWVHRTTLGMRSPAALPAINRPSQDADDALTALLSARGLI